MSYRIPVVLVALCVAILIALPLCAEPDPEAQKVLESIKWTNGPGEGNLRVASIDVPHGYVFATGNDVEKLMTLMQNPTSGREVGFLAPEDMSWFAVFEFDESGYVKDDEGANLDADALLKSIREGTAEGNEERKKRGWPAFNLVGWEHPPRYNATTHNLEWAIRGESEGSQVVNYNTRILGRRGVMEISLVVDPPQLAGTLPTYQSLLSKHEFNAGERYAEFRQGDKMAAYGLAALVTGGAAVAATKSGFLAKIVKFLGKGLIAIGIAVAALFKKLFGRDPSDSRNYSE